MSIVDWLRGFRSNQRLEKLNHQSTIINRQSRDAFRLPTSESTEIYEAILDTGAFVSVLPKRLWKRLKREIWVEDTFFSGIKPGKACRVQASFGTVSGYFCDKTGNRTRDYEFPAFLAKTDKVPLIVGFAGLLEKLAVYEVNC